MPFAGHKCVLVWVTRASLGSPFVNQLLSDSAITCEQVNCWTHWKSTV